MNKTVHYLGLDVHKETIAVSIAPANSTEVRRYGIVNGTLDAVDKLLKKLALPGIEQRVVYEAGPWGRRLRGRRKPGRAGGQESALKSSRVVVQ